MQLVQHQDTTEILSQSLDEVGEEQDLLGISTVDQLDEGSCDDSSKEQKDVGIQNAAVMLDSVAQTCTLLKEDAEVQAVVEASTDINPGLLNIARHVATTTEDLNAPATQFSIESIQHDDKAILFYTGFPSYILLLTCLNFFGLAAMVLCYDKKSVDPEAGFVGRHRALTPMNEFFLTRCRLRLALKEQDLAYRFQISQSTVSRIITTWLNFMLYKFKEVPIWPSRQAIDHFMPDCFQTTYHRTRCIIDATELFIEMPSNPSAQQLTFSNYKNHNTAKALVGITPLPKMFYHLVFP